MGLFVVTMATLKPEIAPRADEGITWKQRLDAMVKVAPALILIIIVLGSIYTGIATATEALRSARSARSWSSASSIVRSRGPTIKKILLQTTKISGSLLIIVGSAFVFTQMLVVVRAAEALTTFVGGLSIPSSLIVIILLIIVVALGGSIDAASLMLVITPILLRHFFESLGYDPLWVGVILVVTPWRRR